MCGAYNLQSNMAFGAFLMIPGIFNLIYVSIMLRHYILWFTENRTCQFKCWFYYQCVGCVYAIGWWTCLFAFRVMYLRNALRNSEKHDANNHRLRILQRITSDDPGFIERPVGSYEEVAQQNGAAAQLILMLLLTEIYNMYLHAVAYMAMKKFIEEKDKALEKDNRKYEMVEAENN